MDWQPRLAREGDISQLEALISISIKRLRAHHYSRGQMEAALGSVFGVDRQLIRDGTYFVVEREGQIIDCGGWSKRKTLFGGDAIKRGMDMELDPNAIPRESARSLFIQLGRVVASPGQSSNVVRGQIGSPAFALSNL